MQANASIVYASWCQTKAPVNHRRGARRVIVMNSIIYVIGLVVVVLFILSFFGLR
jgi:hypothetical protein